MRDPAGALRVWESEGGHLQACCLHGSRSDLTTGRPAGPPATNPVPVYPVRIVSGTVEIQMPATTGSRDTR